jgi:TM2 domain-containing membrane protein YozV
MVTRKDYLNIYLTPLYIRVLSMGISFYNGQICVEGIICGSFIEIGITFIALFVIYVAYEAIYKKDRP